MLLSVLVSVTMNENEVRVAVPSKALAPIDDTESGSAKAVRPDDLKAALPIAARPVLDEEKVNEVRLAVSEKAYCPIDATESGSTNAVKAVAP